MRRAAELYDAPESELSNTAGEAGRHGFRSGAMWMRRAMVQIRGVPIPEPITANFHALGWLKYGAASIVALGWAIAMIAIDWPVLAIGSIPLFYAVEAQGVFLFPVAIDGEPRPFRAARRRHAARQGYRHAHRRDHARGRFRRPWISPLVVLGMLGDLHLVRAAPEFATRAMGNFGCDLNSARTARCKSALSESK